MPLQRILIVDDEPGMLEVCRDTLQQIEATDIHLEQESRRACERLAAENWDLLIADIRMPEVDGIEVLHIAREHDANLPVLMITAFPSVETAVESMKLGAADYITKPFLPEDLLARVRRLLDEKRLREESRLLQRQVDKSCTFGEIVGQCSAMQDLFEKIRRLAETNVDVLILGETGTGKELVARSVHQRSGRHGRFVPVDCGAIPEDLLESELFGHERGAFTGAQTRSLGLLEFADKGSFFLDEVGELPIRLQGKLLRVLQERKVRRVGGREEIPVDVRVIAATSRKLEDEVRQKRFREDLYYRINVARIELPPLRERREDIPLLVNHFFERYAREMGKPSTAIDAEVVEIFLSYPWPGNVRELQNVLKQALAMTRNDTVTVDDLPDGVVAGVTQAPRGNGGFFDLCDRRMAAFARGYFVKLLQSTHGDMTRAAEKAQLPRGTLYRLLKKHGLNPGDFRD